MQLQKCARGMNGGAPFKLGEDREGKEVYPNEQEKEAKEYAGLVVFHVPKPALFGTGGGKDG